MRRAAAIGGLLTVAGCTNDVPFFTGVPERKHPTAVIDPVLVAETGGAVASFDSFVRYEASGESSHDPDGEIVEWTWRVLSQPEGSGMSIEAIEEVEDLSRVNFRPDLVGAYGIELVVTDDDGLESEPAV